MKDGNIMNIKTIRIILIAFICTFFIAACSSDTEYHKVKGYDTAGLIKDYDENNNEDILTETVLEKHLPEISGYATFASVDILGEENGKIYTSNVYADYDSSGKLISRKMELAEFNSITDKDYRYIDNDDLYVNINTFLPESILNEKQQSEFDWYVYMIGGQTESVNNLAKEYFSK